jgi:hypothetical protein
MKIKIKFIANLITSPPAPPPPYVFALIAPSLRLKINSELFPPFRKWSLREPAVSLEKMP